MATNWQGVVLEQAEQISNSLRQLASSGLHFLHNEFGIDLGLNPEAFPTWLVLSTASGGITVLLVLAWLAACGGVGRKKREAVASERRVNVDVNVTVTDAAAADTKAPVTKAVKPEEPKKRNRKKAQKTQPNGRTVAEPQEEIKKPQEEIKKPQEVTPEAPKPVAPPPPPQPQVQPPPPADVKADKAKKSKKKPKAEVKQTQGVTPADGKEPDEGAWETKISNREKRQQRRKEKGPNDGSPGGVDNVSQQVEPPPVKASVSTKKNKETVTSKAGKSDAVITPATTNWNAKSSVNSGGWTEGAVKLSSQVNAAENEKWPVGIKASGHRNSEPLSWGGKKESEGSWTGMDGRFKPELSAVNFSILGLKPPVSGGDSVTQSPAELTHYGIPAADSEWSGINGLGSVDPSSDWNAPTELWGNYEEPKAEIPAPQERPVTQPHRESDDDKEKGDPSGSGKSKKKKKKKKKPEDENAVSQVTTESLSAPVESSAVKPLPRVPVEEPAKQNINPFPSKKKSEQNWEPPKQVQKKKARRET